MAQQVEQIDMSTPVILMSIIEYENTHQIINTQLEQIRQLRALIEWMKLDMQELQDDIESLIAELS